MRKIIVYNVISLDGYHTGLGNDVTVMFLMMGDTFNTYNAELLRTADVQLMGRVSFELLQSFWPKVAENPDAYSDSERELSQASQSVKGIVVSDTLQVNWQDLRIIRRQDAYQQTYKRGKSSIGMKTEFEYPAPDAIYLFYRQGEKS